MTLLLTVMAIAAMLIFLFDHHFRRHADENADLTGQLADSEALYRSTVDSLVDGVIIQDTEGRVIQMNRAAEAILTGSEIGDVPEAGESFADYLPELINEYGEPLGDDERPVLVAVATGKPVVGKVIGVRLGSNERWFRCNATPASDPRSDEKRMVLTFSEITRERELSARLAEQEERFRLALDHAPIGIALIAADGAFIEVNEALCELVHESRSDLLDRNFRELIHPLELDQCIDVFAGLLDGQAETSRAERRLIRIDRSIVPVVLAVAIARPDDGSDPYFIAHIPDISDRRSAEIAQRNALEKERDMVAQLRELDETKTNFVSTVSHELRTPLTSAIGYLELLSDGAVGQLSDQQLEMIGVVERNSERLLGLIENLLTLSEGDSKSRMKVTDVDVEELVTGVETTLKPIAEQGEVTLTSAVDDRSTSVSGDPSQLGRVLINIVGNAIKFTPPGGEVTVEAGPTEDRVDHLTIRITDTGIGIPEDEQPRLFTRFFRSSAAHENAVPGTGLGLAIAADLIRAHDGTITVESSEGVGTTVTMTLPTGPGAERPRGPGLLEASPGPADGAFGA